MDIQIVDFKPEHIDGALEIFHQSTILHCTNVPEYFCQREAKDALPYLRHVLENDSTFGFVALCGGDIAGILFAGLEHKPDNTFIFTQYYKIYDIAVGEAYRGKGIGKMLNKAIEQKARDNGIIDIELDVFCFNTGAQEFYRKLGYADVFKTMRLLVKDS